MKVKWKIRMPRHVLVITLGLLTVFYSSSGFILDTDPCPAPSPCRCYSTVINCAHTRLTQIPTFHFTKIHYREMEIDLQKNTIVSIPDNALGNIKAATPETLELKLNDNQINNISDRAFENLGLVSVTLVLSNNKLRTLPHALTKIQNLNTLRLLNNPLVYLDGTVLTSIGKTLKTLWIDMSTVAIWPREFSNFGTLYELWVDNLPFKSIPSDSFVGLNGLMRLQISNARLQSVPDAICSLAKLQHFDFNHNIYMLNSISQKLSVCKSALSNATLAYFNNNNMFSFPDTVFSVFPRLRTLGLSFNYLNHINPDVIPNNCTLYYLYLSNNDFTKIPQAVSKMPELLTLVVSYNKITSVDGQVFSSLKNFRQLTISHNPLLYIDPHAFSTSYSLKNLYVEYTNMTSVPAAILHSNDRSAIDLTGSPVQCTCSNMAFLHALSKSDVESGKKFFRGDCVNENMTIKAYILNILPRCI